ncbi:MAG: hypothetical protein IPG70_07840 [Moraxellaceae bacterium]|nr:hypothetical protein [Moraxellaceae bacterium]
MDNPLHICVLVLPEVAVAFKRENNQTWQDYVIKGEASYYHNQKATTLQDILGDINDRLFRNDKKLLSVQVSLVYAPACRHLMESSIKTLHSLACEQWQILAWQSLYQQAATLNNSKLDDKVPSLPWIKSHILPLLGYDAELERLRQKEHANALRAIEDQKKQLAQDINSQQQTAKQSHAQMLAALEAEKNKLLQELQELKQQQNILAQP